MLRDALMEQPSATEDIHAQERMRQMHSFIELMTDWLDDVQKMDSATLANLMQMGAKVQQLLEMKERVKQVFVGKPPTEQPHAYGAIAATDSASGPPQPPFTQSDNPGTDHGQR
jgi:hypothetical protein